MLELEKEFVEFHYSTPSLLEKCGGLWLVRLGRNIAKPHYRVGPKSIECYSLHIITSGSLLFRYEESYVTLSKGDIFIMYPDSSYYYEVVNGDPKVNDAFSLNENSTLNENSNENNRVNGNSSIIESSTKLKMCWIAFQGAQSEELLRRVGVTPRAPFRQGNGTIEAVEQIHRIIDLYTQEDSNAYGHRLYILGQLYSLFGMLLQENGITSAGSEPNWTERAKDYIDMHYMEPITVESLAAQFGLHRSYFSSKFLEKIGMSPNKYIQQQRMNKGAQLLLHSQMTVTQIALSLNYSELCSFTRAFQNYFGKSPVLFRQTAKVI